VFGPEDNGRGTPGLRDLGHQRDGKRSAEALGKRWASGPSGLREIRVGSRVMNQISGSFLASPRVASEAA
jgi:hypothetical protein